MFEKSYKSMNGQIAPDRALIDRTLELMNSETEITKPKTKLFYRKPVAIAAMLLICIFTAMPALAANVPIIYELMYLVSPATAQFFMPVQESCENNGIRMEVVSAYIHDDTAEIYITLQDLTGDRIDETTDLYDSYSIHRPFDSIATCQRVGYDESTKTATFLISITEWGGYKIEGDKLTFSVRHFISGKHEYEGVPIEIDLGAIKNNHETKKTEIIGGSGIKFREHFSHDKTHADTRATVLATSDSIYSPVQGIDVTGIGYIDGMLHVQMAITDRLKNDNHGYFYLMDNHGKKITYDYSVSFIEYSEQGNEDTRIDYNEFVFDVPQDEIASYTLYGSFFTSGLFTEGRWQVTIPLVASDEK